MKTDHAHVEASVLALVLLAALAGMDLFVDMADGRPEKCMGYLLLFLLTYATGYAFFRRLWRRP